METDSGLKSQASREKDERVSADDRDTFNLENLRDVIQMAEKRSRQERCKCGWDYATGQGTQRAYNPLCPVHDPERVATAIESEFVKA